MEQKKTLFEQLSGTCVYLREYRKVTYTNLLTSGRLNAYLADFFVSLFAEHCKKLICGVGCRSPPFNLDFNDFQNSVEGFWNTNKIRDWQDWKNSLLWTIRNGFLPYSVFTKAGYSFLFLLQGCHTGIFWPLSACRTNMLAVVNHLFCFPFSLDL